MTGEKLVFHLLNRPSKLQQFSLLKVLRPAVPVFIPRATKIDGDVRREVTVEY